MQRRLCIEWHGIQVEDSCSEQVVLQVLTYGIASAAILRLVVIGLGTELVDNFQIVNLGFAAFLIFNAWQMVTAGNGEEEDLADKWIVKACRCQFLPCLSLPKHCHTVSAVVRKWYGSHVLSGLTLQHAL